jgi:hypothetical protein
MADINDVMRDAVSSLHYAVMALEAPEGASIRDTLEEFKEARHIVAEVTWALETIVEVERNGGSAQAMRLIAAAALKRAKGTNND